jgi:hypothetical protein
LGVSRDVYSRDTHIKFWRPRIKILKTSHKILKASHKILKASHKILKASLNILKASHKTLKALHKILKASHKILKTSHKIVIYNCYISRVSPVSHRTLQLKELFHATCVLYLPVLIVLGVKNYIRIPVVCTTEYPLTNVLEGQNHY